MRMREKNSADDRSILTDTHCCRSLRIFCVCSRNAVLNTCFEWHRRVKRVQVISWDRLSSTLDERTTRAPASDDQFLKQKGCTCNLLPWPWPWRVLKQPRSPWNWLRTRPRDVKVSRPAWSQDHFLVSVSVSVSQ